MEQQILWITVVVAMAMMAFPFNCLATEYTVGDSQQWALGVNYTAWASGKTFAVGDKLVFTYSSSQHDVLAVNKAAYDSCTATSPLNSYTSGNDTLALNSKGVQYYICGFTGHCSGGMKLAITVGAASTSKSNGSAPSPSPVSSPSPAPPTPATVKSPPPSSTPSTPTVQSPSPLSGTTAPAAPSPSSSSNGASPPSGSNTSAAATSYGMGGILLGGSLLLAMASL